MNFNNLLWFDLNFIPCLAISFFLNAIILYLWQHQYYKHFGLNQYKAVQRIHLHETPRLGGMVMLTSLAIYVLRLPLGDTRELLTLLLLSLSPSLFFSFKEDLFHNVRPLLRLLSLLASGLLFVKYYTGPWPQVTVPVIGPLLSTKLGILLFYPLAMAAVTNGMNLVDGVNGLCAMVSLSILGILIFLAHQTLDHSILMTASGISLLLIVFLLFNYPYGRIFLGDLGAYSLGMMLSMLVIVTYGRHPELPSWGAVLIVIYPLTEAVFSLTRRLVKGHSVSRPDLLHLHLKLYLFFKPQPHFKRMANAIVMPALAILWLAPLILMSWFYQKPIFILSGIVIFLSLYGFLYKKIPPPKKKR
jgi:UDP-N-acetylmuramyl pentapeptide phosphotransferase/UDP-N-acetylglucosamine-1-phosphate transferase